MLTLLHKFKLLRHWNIWITKKGSATFLQVEKLLSTDVSLAWIYNLTVFDKITDLLPQYQLHVFICF